MGFFGCAEGGGNPFHNLQWHVFDDRARLNAAGAQVVKRQVAGSLEDKRLKVLNGTVVEGTGDAQVSLLQQVLGGTVVIHHPL